MSNIAYLPEWSYWLTFRLPYGGETVSAAFGGTRCEGEDGPVVELIWRQRPDGSVADGVLIHVRYEFADEGQCRLQVEPTLSRALLVGCAELFKDTAKLTGDVTGLLTHLRAEGWVDRTDVDTLADALGVARLSPAEGAGDDI